VRVGDPHSCSCESSARHILRAESLAWMGGSALFCGRSYVFLVVVSSQRNTLSSPKPSLVKHEKRQRAGCLIIPYATALIRRAPACRLRRYRSPRPAPGECWLRLPPLRNTSSKRRADSSTPRPRSSAHQRSPPRPDPPAAPP